MNNLGDHLKKRSAELNLDRGPALEVIQVELDALYPTHCRAMALNDGTLKIITSEAAVASELRLRQVELMGRFQQKTGEKITRLVISIRSL